MRKKCKSPLENFAQEFRLCMVLILIQRDQKIRKPAKKTLYVRVFTVPRGSALLISLLRTSTTNASYRAVGFQMHITSHFIQTNYGLLCYVYEKLALVSN